MENATWESGTQNSSLMAVLEKYEYMHFFKSGRKTHQIVKRWFCLDGFFKFLL
jgi:hypothetical protein